MPVGICYCGKSIPQDSWFCGIVCRTKDYININGINWLLRLIREECCDPDELLEFIKDLTQFHEELIKEYRQVKKMALENKKRSFWRDCYATHPKFNSCRIEFDEDLNIINIEVINR